METELTKCKLLSPPFCFWWALKPHEWQSLSEEYQSKLISAAKTFKHIHDDPLFVAIRRILS